MVNYPLWNDNASHHSVENGLEAAQLEAGCKFMHQKHQEREVETWTKARMASEVWGEGRRLHLWGLVMSWIQSWGSEGNWKWLWAVWLDGLRLAITWTSQQRARRKVQLSCNWESVAKTDTLICSMFFMQVGLSLLSHRSSTEFCSFHFSNLWLHSENKPMK